MEKEIQQLEFYINHSKVANLKVNMLRGLKISLRAGQLIAPYVLTAAITFGGFAAFGGMPFIKNDQKKKIEMKDRIDRQLMEVFPNGDWRTKDDGSLHNGSEINSPILRDTKTNWENLNKVCSIVEPLASIDTKSGGHIHIGTQTLGSNRDSWLNFIKMWSVYKNIIFRFGYGDFLTARPSMLEYAEPMTKDFWRDYEKLKSGNASLDAIISKISYKRYQAVNFNNVSRNNCNNFDTKNTIEFRCPNGTLDAAIWQNNVNLFVRMLCYSKSTAFNDDLVQQRHQLNLDRFAKLKWYDEIYLGQAL